MDISQINEIRQTIELAKSQEAKTGHLAQLLQEGMDQLHNAIELPEHNAVGSLVDFVVRYIEHVPDFLEAVSRLTHEAGIFDHTEAFVDIARDYFLKPPEIVDDHSGLDALMDEAYLAHRLMEEINDRFIGRCGIPLAPMDMTRANLIVHHLIGEPFANELDKAVQYSVELLMNQEQVFEKPTFQHYVTEHKARGWSEELQRWPCLASDLEINLKFDESAKTDLRDTSPPDTMH